MLHGYQIDNVVFVIEGLKSQRPISELLKTVDPLGDFPQLSNIKAVDAEDYGSLYQEVLVDLPVGQYFRKYLDEVTASAALDENHEIDTKYIAEVMKDQTLQQI